MHSRFLVKQDDNKNDDGDGNNGDNGVVMIMLMLLVLGTTLEWRTLGSWALPKFPRADSKRSFVLCFQFLHTL